MMNLYYKYQPVTWYIGVIEASLDAVVDAIQPLYAPPDRLRNIYHETGNIDEALVGLQPIGLSDKFLLVETKDGHTALFANAFYSLVEMPTWTIGKNLNVSVYFVCNVPNTISRDRKFGAYGGRILEFRKPEDPYGNEPTYRVSVINDAGKWCFERYGEKLAFEDEKAYKSFRKPNRFTVEILENYCREFGIPVYDREWYSNSRTVIERIPLSNVQGINYQEAAVKFRIKQDMQHTTMP